MKKKPPPPAPKKAAKAVKPETPIAKPETPIATPKAPRAPPRPPPPPSIVATADNVTEANPKRDLITVRTLLARYAANSADVTAAYTSLATDETRSEKGKKTRGKDILHEGAAVAVQIDAAFREHNAAVGAA